MKDRVSTAGSGSEPPQGDKRAALYFDDVHAPIGALCRIRVNSLQRPPARLLMGVPARVERVTGMVPGYVRPRIDNQRLSWLVSHTEKRPR